MSGEACGRLENGRFRRLVGRTLVFFEFVQFKRRNTAHAGFDLLDDIARSELGQGFKAPGILGLDVFVLGFFLEFFLFEVFHVFHGPILAPEMGARNRKLGRFAKRCEFSI